MDKDKLLTEGYWRVHQLEVVCQSFLRACEEGKSLSELNEHYNDVAIWCGKVRNLLEEDHR